MPQRIIKTKGDKGDSAYTIAVNILGFTGTAKQWLQSLVGKKLEVQNNGSYIQVKYENETSWVNLISLEELKRSPISLDVIISSVEPSNPTEGTIWLDIN